jgi:hypothetical protein
MDELLSDNAIVQAAGFSDFENKLGEILFGDRGLGLRAAAAVESRRGVVEKCVERIRGALA